MPSHERPNPNIGGLPNLTELTTELGEITQRLEMVDKNENTMERSFKREELSEQQDLLQSTIDELPPPPDP